MAKFFLTAIIIINNPGGAGSRPTGPFKPFIQLNALFFAGVMVKPQAAAFCIRYVGQDIIFIDFYEPVLNILGMNKKP
jgi:hypothetical protein